MGEYINTEIGFDEVEVLDMRRARVRLDDEVVAGFRCGNSSETRIGIVRALRRRTGTQPYNRDRVDFFIKIEWVKSSSWGLPDRPTWISVDMERPDRNSFVVVRLPDAN